MSIEAHIEKLTATLEAHTKALNANTEAILKGGNVIPMTHPDPDPEQETPTPSEEVPEVPTKVSAKPAKTATKPANDTPNVPAKTPPLAGQPEAGEHVDVDEVIAEINTIIRNKVIAAKAATGSDQAVKDAWTAIRQSYGVERIAELRNDPARLLQAKAQANAL